jgi:hypothetical protein
LSRGFFDRRDPGTCSEFRGIHPVLLKGTP